jgi:hypothetical protein
VSIAIRPTEIVRPSTDSEARALLAWGTCNASNEPKATDEQIGRHLEFIAATLPTKRVDTETGKSRFAVYLSLLRGMSDQALAYMSRRVCSEFDWFPTPHQCMTVLNDFTGDKLTRKLAVRYSQDYWQERMEAFMAELADGNDHQLSTVDERWKSIAETRMLLRRLGDGSYELRAPTGGTSRTPAREEITPSTEETGR